MLYSLLSNPKTGSPLHDTVLEQWRCPQMSFLENLHRVSWFVAFNQLQLLLITFKPKPTAENHIPPAQALEAARAELLTIFKRNFEQASVARDSAATSRFFKLFPAIGWESEGLEAYAAFVVDLVRVRAPTSAKSTILSFLL